MAELSYSISTTYRSPCDVSQREMDGRLVAVGAIRLRESGNRLGDENLFDNSRSARLGFDSSKERFSLDLPSLV